MAYGCFIEDIALGSHLSITAKHFWPEGDRFRQVPLYIPTKKNSLAVINLPNTGEQPKEMISKQGQEILFRFKEAFTMMIYPVFVIKKAIPRTYKLLNDTKL